MRYVIEIAAGVVFLSLISPTDLSFVVKTGVTLGFRHTLGYQWKMYAVGRSGNPMTKSKEVGVLNLQILMLRRKVFKRLEITQRRWKAVTIGELLKIGFVIMECLICILSLLFLVFLKFRALLLIHSRNTPI